MKFLVLCLTVCTAFAFAEGAYQLGAIHPSGSGSVSTDGIVFSQVYTYAALQNGYRYYNTTSEQGYMTAPTKAQSIDIIV